MLGRMTVLNATSRLTKSASSKGAPKAGEKLLLSRQLESNFIGPWVAHIKNTIPFSIQCMLTALATFFSNLSKQQSFFAGGGSQLYIYRFRAYPKRLTHVSSSFTTVDRNSIAVSSCMSENYKALSFFHFTLYAGKFRCGFRFYYRPNFIFISFCFTFHSKIYSSP